MSTALFAMTTDDQWVRLSDWVTQPEGDALWDEVKDLPREYVVTADLPLNHTATVKFFALRPNMHEWPYKTVSTAHGIRVWSKRTYVGDTAAAKAWNRTLNNRYHGTEGGWIYEGTRRVCQGWVKVPGVHLMREEGGKYRFLYKTVSTQVEVAA